MKLDVEQICDIQRPGASILKASFVQAGICLLCYRTIVVSSKLKFHAPDGLPGALKLAFACLLSKVPKRSSGAALEPCLLALETAKQSILIVCYKLLANYRLACLCFLFVMIYVFIMCNVMNHIIYAENKNKTDNIASII